MERSKSPGPHCPPPGHCVSDVHCVPGGAEPPTQVAVTQLPLGGQSSSVAHGLPSFEPPPVHTFRSGPRRATRRIVYGASADPKRVISPVSFGLNCGSKIGGRTIPSGVYEARKFLLGRWIGLPLPKAGRLVLARRMR